MLLMIFTFVKLKVIIEQQVQEEIWGLKTMEQHMALAIKLYIPVVTFPSGETISFCHIFLSLHLYSSRANYDLSKSSTLF